MKCIIYKFTRQNIIRQKRCGPTEKGSYSIHCVSHIIDLYLLMINLFTMEHEVELGKCNLAFFRYVENCNKINVILMEAQVEVSERT